MSNNKIFNLNPLPSWVYDVEKDTILDVNEAAIKLYGYTKEEFLNLTLKDLRPETEIPILKATLKEIEEKEGKIELGIFIHKKNQANLLMLKFSLTK